VARYYFDVHENDRLHRDESGSDMEDLQAVRREAMNVLPRLALDTIKGDGDRQTFVVVVSDEGGTPVYAATLNFTGTWLSPSGEHPPGRER
jgi:hypothetical protein